MKKIVSVMCFLLLLVSLTSVVSAKDVVDGDNLKFSKEDIVKIQDSFSELGIDKQTQKELIEKLKNGEVLDSMKTENLQKAATLLSAKGNNFKTITFEDGSKLNYGTELVQDTGIQPMLSSGSYTVKSYLNFGILSYSFYTDFVIRSGSDNDYIKKSYNPDVTLLVPGGSVSGEKVTVERKYETSSRRAYSRMDFRYSVPFGGSTSVDLYFHVGDNDYESKSSLDDVK